MQCKFDESDNFTIAICKMQSFKVILWGEVEACYIVLELLIN